MAKGSPALAKAGSRNAASSDKVTTRSAGQSGLFPAPNVSAASTRNTDESRSIKGRHWPDVLAFE